MHVLRDTRLYYKRKIKELLRNPAFIFMGISTPIIYLALFSPLLKKMAGGSGFPTDNVLTVFVPGMLVMASFLNGLFAGWGIIDELRSGVIERFRVTPCSRFAMIAGPVLRDLVANFVQGLFFVLIALPFGFRASVGGMAILFVLLCLLLITTSSLAHALGLIVKSEEKLAPIVQGINLPILLLSGMLLPMAMAPNWLQILAHFNPVYYVVEAGRKLAFGEIQTAMVGYAFLIMVPLTALTLAWATKVFRKATY